MEGPGSSELTRCVQVPDSGSPGSQCNTLFSVLQACTTSPSGGWEGHPSDWLWGRRGEWAYRSKSLHYHCAAVWLDGLGEWDCVGELGPGGPSFLPQWCLLVLLTEVAPPWADAHTRCTAREGPMPVISSDNCQQWPATVVLTLTWPTLLQICSHPLLL